MEIVDRTGKPREDGEILDAIELMGTVIVKVMKYPPQLVIFAPAIRDGLKELLIYRKATVRPFVKENPLKMASELKTLALLYKTPSVKGSYYLYGHLSGGQEVQIFANQQKNCKEDPDFFLVEVVEPQKETNDN